MTRGVFVRPSAVMIVLVGLLVAVPAAGAGRPFRVGLFDDGQFLYGNPRIAFTDARVLHAQLVRVTLHWGGRLGVARRRPRRPWSPADRAYDWRLYDRAVQSAQQNRLNVVFSIVDTPAWANGGGPPNVAPRRPADLQAFAFAAAMRYSGTFVGHDGRTLPPVRLWLAWNEPNNPLFLAPQFRRVRRRWVIQSAYDYARICRAIVRGVHGTYLAGEQVACGVTSPRGNNNPRSARPSVSPIAFLRALKHVAPRLRFDAYAHHPYPGTRLQQPGTAPPLTRGQTTAVTLGNINTMIAAVTNAYGRKPLWITEYGYQTDPPDRLLGVPLLVQARYLIQAFALARANPRITMMLWFLLKDERRVGGWQSGLETVVGKKKPSYMAFQLAARTHR